MQITPETAASIDSFASESRLSRRTLVQRMGLLGVAAALPFPALLRADSATTRARPQNHPLKTAHYSFRIGDISAISLSDGGIQSSASKPIWAGSDPAKLLADLEEAAMPTSHVELPFNVLLLQRGPETILIDAGSGPLFGPTAGALPLSLAEAGITPGQITGIIITHAHSDHFGGLLEAATLEPLFPKARLFIHRREYAYWTAERPDVSAMLIPENKARGMFPKAKAYLEKLKSSWELVSPGDKILDWLELLDAPGHTPGHLALRISSGNEQLYHLVDVVHHHAISFANPKWKYLYDSDPVQAVETRLRLFDRITAEKARIYGAHLPFPGLGRIRRQGPVYQHVIEPWVSLAG